jgi:hypothetical protein
MSSPAPGSSGAVRPLAALAYATVGFVALVIAGFGMTSLLLDADVIAVPGLGAAPGALGVALATLSFAGVVWATVRTARPSYGGSALAAVAAFLGYLAGVWFGALLAGVDLARATAAAGGFATSVFALVLLGAAFVSGWVAVALVRTRAHRPRWPWERDDEP